MEIKTSRMVFATLSAIKRCFEFSEPPNYFFAPLINKGDVLTSVLTVPITHVLTMSNTSLFRVFVGHELILIRRHKQSMFL